MSSWKTTSTPSLVERMSNSLPSPPSSKVARNASSVFSWANSDAPRWQMMSVPLRRSATRSCRRLASSAVSAGWPRATKHIASTTTAHLDGTMTLSCGQPGTLAILTASARRHKALLTCAQACYPSDSVSPGTGRPKAVIMATLPRSGLVVGLVLVGHISSALAAGPTRYLTKPDDWFAGDEGKRVAANILSHQSDAGGWPKNTDTTAPFTGNRKDIKPTFDNGATTDELRFLARSYAATRDATYKAAFEQGLD